MNRHPKSLLWISLLTSSPFLLATDCQAAALGGIAPALAYIGPGAGLGAIGALLALLAAVAIGLVGLVLYPLHLLRQKLGGKSTADPTEPAQPSASNS